MSNTLLPAQKKLGELVGSGRKSSGIRNLVSSQKCSGVVKFPPRILCSNNADTFPKSSLTSQSRLKSTSAVHRPSDVLSSRLARSAKTLGSSHCRNVSTSVTTIQDVVSYIKDGHCKSIVVMVGAGISTASGIPDFRSPGTGLYDNLQQYKIPYPEAIFDLDYFYTNPKPFFTLAKEIYPAKKYRPNSVHYFLKLLCDKDLLLRLYTQNIDGLERLAGIPSDKLVEAHGTFMSASCTKCRQSSPIEPVKEAIFSDKIPRCQRSHCRGIVKPNIVFFGEDLPSRFYNSFKRDFAATDLLLILGTSLEVEPFAGIAGCVEPHAPRVLFNRELVGPFKRRRTRINDIACTGDIVQQIGLFVEMLGWTSSLNELVSGSEHHHDCANAESVSSEDANKPENDVGIKMPSKFEAQQTEKNGMTDVRENIEPSQIAESSPAENIARELNGLHITSCPLSKSATLQSNEESKSRTKDSKS